jgi:hypothetical protein
MMITTNIFPRVLIISAVPLSTNSATGITLQNLFSGWPKDCIAQIYDDTTEPDSSICGSFRRFSSSDMPVVRIAKSAIQRFRFMYVKTVEKAHASGTIMPSGSISYGFLSACGDIVPFALPESIYEWVTSFQPDVIYSVLGSVRMMNIVLKLNEQFSTPIVAHFMDDWPTTAYSRSWKLAVPRAILNVKLRSVLAKSPRRMTICEDMATEFTRQYGGQFESFMNCVEIPSRIPPCYERENNEVHFGFIGGLHLNRWYSLLKVANALQELKDEGAVVVLNIFAPQKDLKIYGALFKDFSVIGEMKTLKASDVNEKLVQSDVLVHVESFLHEDSLYTRLSVSTKIPQYMASGRPILAFGPGSLSSLRYIERMGAGLVVDVENDIPILKKTAGQLASSSNQRKSLGGNGFQVAKQSHNEFVVRDRFRDVLAKAAKESG